MVCAALVLYLSKDYLMHLYYIDKIDTKYQESLTYCDDSFDIYMEGSSEKVLSSLNQCNSYLSENLKYLRNHKKFFIFGPEQLREENILSDIGMNYAYTAIHFEKNGNTVKYNEYMQKALPILQSVWGSDKTENNIRRMVNGIEKKYKSEQKKFTLTAYGGVCLECVFFINYINFFTSVAVCRHQVI